MRNILKATVATFFVVMVALLLPLGMALGQDISFNLFPVSAETGEDLGRLIYILEPGESATDAVVAVSNSNSPMVVTTFGTAAGTASNGGTVFPETATPDSWVVLSVPELPLDGQEQGQFFFTVAVPEDASPGEYLFGIVVQDAGQGDKQREDSAVSFTIAMRQVLTVYVTVPGIQVASFEVSSIKQVWDGPDVGFDVELHNTGNVRVRPTGTLDVTDRSGKVIGSFPIKLGPILAGDTLVHHISSGSTLPPGRYGASVQMSFTPVTVASTEESESVAVEEKTITVASNFEITEEVLKAVVKEAQQQGWNVEGVVINQGPGQWLYIIGGAVIALILLLLLGMALWLRFHPFRSRGSF